MSQISNEKQFREAIDALDSQQQRLVAGRFVEIVLPLGKDPRLASIVKAATDPNASEDDLRTARKSGQSTSIELSTRCGANGDWTDQAGYFVARAATAAVTPPELCKAGGPAWQAALNSRMAETCESIDATDEKADLVREQQYQILSEFLKS